MARAFNRSMSNSWPVQNNDSKTWTDELLDTLQVVQVGVACTRSSQRRQRTSGEQLWKTTGGRLCQMPRSDLSCSSAFFGPPQSDYNMHLYSGILGVTFEILEIWNRFSVSIISSLTVWSVTRQSCDLVRHFPVVHFQRPQCVTVTQYRAHQTIELLQRESPTFIPNSTHLNPIGYRICGVMHDSMHQTLVRDVVDLKGCL